MAAPSRTRTETVAYGARAARNPPVRPAGPGFVRLGLHLVALQLCCSAACELRTALRSCHKASAVRSSQAAEQHSRSATRCSPSLTKQLPAGRTGGFLAARAPYAAVSVRVREGAATCRGLHCSHEPRCTSFWSPAWPVSRSGCCGAPPSRALRDQIGWRARRAFAI